MIELDFHSVPAVAKRRAADAVLARANELEAQLASAQSELSKLREEAVSAQQAFDAIQRAREQSEAQLASAHLEVANLREEALLARQAFDKVREALEESESQRTSAQTRFDCHAREQDELLRQTQQDLDALAARHRDETAALMSALQSAETKLEAALAEEAALRAAQSTLKQQAAAEIEAAASAQSIEIERLRSSLADAEEDISARAADAAALSERLCEQAVDRSTAARLEEEVAVCRKVSERSIFVIGFARSNTTITVEMLNCANNALILSEANFFLGEHGENFRRWYNDQHVSYQNQVTKSSYAPDFSLGQAQSWWEWLNDAGKLYDVVGEKVALTHHHLNAVPPQQIQSFFESRFLSARYIFMMRNPVDVLLSTAKLIGAETDEQMALQCIAWLNYMQLWCDSIRVFPRTMTLVAERFGPETVRQIESFTGLELGDAHVLINPANKRRHRLTSKFPTLELFRSDLDAIYADALLAVDESSALWQAEQKRTPEANDTKGTAVGMVAIASRPLGRVWLKVQQVRDAIVARMKEDYVEA